MSTRIRPAAVADRFYPGRPDDLAATVDELLAAAPAPDPDGLAPPEALVVPHAGYVYSGPVAASGYARLGPQASQLERVVLAGPAHTVALRGMAVPTTDAFTTPLGPVPVDAALRARALACPAVRADDRPHSAEHALEVHLPFLQRLLPADFRVLPVVVGATAPDQVADLFEALWGGPETLVVVSSDLSHYLPYQRAVATDRATATRIVARDVEGVAPADACGAYPLRGLLEVARRRGLTVELVDLRNSGDTAGPPDQVVGYGAFALRPSGATADRPGPT